MEKVCERKVILKFLKELYVVASLVHLKVTYYDVEGSPIIVNNNMDEAKQVKEII